jgi:hypothetical protein
MKGSNYLLKYLRIFSVTIIKGKYRLLVASSVGVMLIISVIMVSSKSVIAQSLQTEKIIASLPRDQFLVGGDPQGIAVNQFA